MTIVAALADGDRVWMAADTGEPIDGSWAGTARKIRRIHLPGASECLLAAAGAAGVLAVAERAITAAGETSADAHRIKPSDPLDKWADRLALYLTKACATAIPPLTEPDRDGMTTVSGTWLLGYAGRLWHLLTHHALPVPDGVIGLGVGADYAVGWMSGHLAARSGIRDQADALRGLASPALVRDAVTAACARIPYCTAPDGPLIEELKPL